MFQESPYQHVAVTAKKEFPVTSICVAQFFFSLFAVSEIEQLYLLFCLLALRFTRSGQFQLRFALFDIVVVSMVESVSMRVSRIFERERRVLNSDSSKHNLLT